MSKLLNIRVMAQTYNEDEVAKNWPRLVSIAWPQWFSKLGLQGIDKELPGYSIGVTPVEKALGPNKHGVVELAEALPDLLKFGKLPKELIRALEEPVKQVEDINQSLSNALADWDAKKANTLTHELEDALSKAEEALRKI